MKMKINRSILLILSAASLLASCGKSADAPQPSRGRNAAPRDTIAPTIVKKDSHEVVTDTAPARRSVPLQNPNGVLEFTTTGLVTGQFKFDDVTATLSQKPSQFIPLLSLEAHKSPPDEHLKLRLYSNSPQLTTGTFSVDSARRKLPRLEASWERIDRVYIYPKQGSLTITQATADHVKGSFEVWLPALTGKYDAGGNRAGPPPVQYLKGTFDMKIQK